MLKLLKNSLFFHSEFKRHFISSSTLTFRVSVSFLYKTIYRPPHKDIINKYLRINRGLDGFDILMEKRTTITVYESTLDKLNILQVVLGKNKRILIEILIDSYMRHEGIKLVMSEAETRALQHVTNKLLSEYE